MTDLNLRQQQRHLMRLPRLRVPDALEGRNGAHRRALLRIDPTPADRERKTDVSDEVRGAQHRCEMRDLQALVR